MPASPIQAAKVYQKSIILGDDNAAELSMLIADPERNAETVRQPAEGMTAKTWRKPRSELITLPNTA